MITRMNVWEQQVGRAAATFPGIGRSNGYLHSILSKTNVSFDGRNPGVGITTQDIPVAQGIDSSSWVSGLVAVRLHERNTWANGASLKIVVQNIMLVPEEPDVVYVATAADVATVSFTNVGTDNPPILRLTQFAAPIGPMLRVLIRWEQGTTVQAGAQTAAISVDLVGRPA